MNGAIRKAAESFNDPKIQYIDIDPAFQGHRFCEEGHTDSDQFNWGSRVYFWQQPTKWAVIIKNGGTVTTYDPANGSYPPANILEKLIDHRVGQAKQDGTIFTLTFRNPDIPDLTMEWQANSQDFAQSGSGGGGLRARTLHPTQDGHREFGNIIVERLKQIYGRTTNPTIILPQSCPAGCECTGFVPRCT
jgi:hypothetical protein